MHISQLKLPSEESFAQHLHAPGRIQCTPDRAVYHCCGGDSLPHPRLQLSRGVSQVGPVPVSGILYAAGAEDTFMFITWTGIGFFVWHRLAVGVPSTLTDAVRLALSYLRGELLPFVLLCCAGLWGIGRCDLSKKRTPCTCRCCTAPCPVT
jgi:hypothetical protein